jgi:hypothetical protein
VTPEPNPYEVLDPLPVAPPRDAVLELRDQLRGQFARMGIDTQVVTTEGTRRFILISPLALADARKLIGALEARPR